MTLRQTSIAFALVTLLLFKPAAAAEPATARPVTVAPVVIESGPLRFAEQPLAQGYTYAYGVTVHDLDGDDQLDITSSDAEPNSNVYLFRGLGKGEFRFSHIQKHAGQEDQPVRLERHAIGDINGDQRPDLVIVDNLKNDIRWFENPGAKAIANSWNLHRITAANDIPGSYDVALADLDGDRDLDVASSCYYGGRFDWFENVGSPGAGSEWKRHLVDKEVGETRTIAAADFNRDGHPDLLGTGRTGNQVVWYQNSGEPATQPWKKQTIDDVTVAPMHGHPVDFDQDGDLDVIMTFGHAAPADADSHQVAWYENVGLAGRGMEWKKHIVSRDHSNGIEVVAGDLDGDRDLDLIATRWAGLGGIAWFENSGDPRGAWQRHNLKEPWGNAITVVVADLDADGRQDIVACAERGSNELRWWRNLGPIKKQP